MSAELTRRTLLVVLAGAGVGGGLWLLARGGSSTVGSADAPTDELLSILAHRDAAVRLGQQVLREAPRFADEKRLIAGLLAGGGGDAGDAVRERLLGSIREDYDEGRLVLIRGWALSETEARLLALAALRSAPPHS